MGYTLEQFADEWDQAAFDPRRSRDERVERRRQFRAADLRQKAEAPEIDAEHRRARGGRARDREERAVPAQHEDEVDLAGNPVAGDAAGPMERAGGGFVVEHLETPPAQGPPERRSQTQRVPDGLGDQADSPEPGPAGGARCHSVGV